MLAACSHAVSALVRTLVVSPIHNLFRHGPMLLGGWAGSSNVEICAQITGTSEDIWNKVPGECDTIIERRFVSYLVTAQTVAYMISVLKCVQVICARFCPSKRPCVVVALPNSPLLLKDSKECSEG